eukprot:Hpha_TRINITY_DN20280_c0_g1::TRINITY_DN20280_c0_g1_i1::g.168285::m.168285
MPAGVGVVLLLFLARCAGAHAGVAATPAPRPVYPPNCSEGLSKQGEYSVVVLQRDAVQGGGALISHANNSAFNFSFTTAWFPVPGGGDGLIVRNVECNPNHHSCAGVQHPEWTNAGALAVVRADLSGNAPPRVSPVTDASVFWPGTSPPPHGDNKPRWGAADPRCAYNARDGVYYLTWDNCTENCYPTRTTLLSTTKTPFDHNSWTLHGPLLPGKYTGGASLLLRAQPPHYAFVGDSNTAHTILLATSHDGVTWTEAAQPFMLSRPGCWDEAGVAAGPQAEMLSSGDYLYIYNIDTGFPYHPSYLGRCAVGWAILDGDDPTRIVARSTDALMVPTLPFETCGGEGGKGLRCQEPLVLFSTGLKPLGNDEFLVIYGAADTDVGMARIKVNVHK